MHQTKKGNQWHFGMKAHIGVDANSGLTHSLVTTAATSMTSISWVICFMERSNLSQPMPATKVPWVIMTPASASQRLMVLNN